MIAARARTNRCRSDRSFLFCSTTSLNRDFSLLDIIRLIVDGREGAKLDLDVTTWTFEEGDCPRLNGVRNYVTNDTVVAVDGHFAMPSGVK